MKPVFVFLIGLATGIVLMVVMCVTDTMPIECGCISYEDTTGGNDPLPPAQGVVITEPEFNQLKNKFQNPTGVSATGEEPGQGAWGGRIGKTALLRLINNLAPEEQFVDFRFGLSDDVVNPKTYLMFISKGGSGVASDRLYITNGGDVESFCPPTCGN